jgi:hypothetical protein
MMSRHSGPIRFRRIANCQDEAGNFDGRLASSSENISLPGLWALLFDGNRLYFSSGPTFAANSGVFVDGLFGFITADRGAK